MKNISILIYVVLMVYSGYSSATSIETQIAAEKKLIKEMNGIISKKGETKSLLIEQLNEQKVLGQEMTAKFEQMSMANNKLADRVSTLRNKISCQNGLAVLGKSLSELNGLIFAGSSGPQNVSGLLAPSKQENSLFFSKLDGLASLQDKESKTIDQYRQNVTVLNQTFSPIVLEIERLNTLDAQNLAIIAAHKTQMRQLKERQEALKNRCQNFNELLEGLDGLGTNISKRYFELESFARYFGAIVFKRERLAYAIRDKVQYHYRQTLFNSHLGDIAALEQEIDNVDRSIQLMDSVSRWWRLAKNGRGWYAEKLHYSNALKAFKEDLTQVGIFVNEARKIAGESSPVFAFAKQKQDILKTQIKSVEERGYQYYFQAQKENLPAVSPRVRDRAACEKLLASFNAFKPDALTYVDSIRASDIFVALIFQCSEE